MALIDFFSSKHHVKVSTPILGVGAGGAVARPFRTTANGFQAERLELRIAPELYLKRLVIGLDKAVFEIGPAFRNEGIDATHNPEFTMCEAYAPFLSLGELKKRVTDMLLFVQAFVSERRKIMVKPSVGAGQELPNAFDSIKFIPSLEKQIRETGFPNYRLPNLSSPTAAAELKELFPRLYIPLPSNPNLPRLLDTLCSHLVEPLCQKPTFIEHHPACMSPLAKSFEEYGQLVSARAELFIKGVEYVNCYEEENDPFVQRRKFEEQLRFKQEGVVRPASDAHSEAGVQETEQDRVKLSDFDENYLEALEWGLPPTGGLGLGFDRLVMFITDAERIQDVLSFGTLRNVVALGKPLPK